ncbi:MULTISPECIES: LysR family transcriptional regulator [Catenuloplanes]|uniref:DNA-binding transcriptional LysR family regulator n=1 Tax=Catenuloplanes niger TaxID=587534 RepID=A0AAE3ZLQ8_9ACTN|nr:LysR family transcriptional regulator [Catenuloplanes niger]MDR7320190.1 DNA-binding transcriptional LysR family regulator [Catenuloplanes niger]
METRELRYFVAVAEESHFGRAAERLGIAQPALSRAVQKMERRLGTPLFVRAGRTVSLTAAGTVLLDEGRNALEAVEAADRRTRRAAPGGRPGIVLVAKAGVSVELLATLLDAYAAEPDAAAVEVVLADLTPGEPERMLRDGRADVALLFADGHGFGGLDHEDIATEGQVVVLPAGHPLAARGAMTADELPDLPQPCWPGAELDVRDGTQLLQLIALGRAFSVLPESSRPSLPGGVVAVPLDGAPPVTTRIAWPAHSRSLTVAALVRVATRLRNTAATGR